MISRADAIALGTRISNIRAAYDGGDLRTVRALAQELLVYLDHMAALEGDEDVLRRLVDLGSHAAHLIVVTEGRDAL